MLLLQGNCLELMKDIPDKSVDMVLCDLPYGITNCKWDKRIPLEPLWEKYKRVCKDNAAIVLFAQMPFGADLIQSNKKMFRYEWIWEKTMALGFLNANKMPMRAHENILVYYSKLPTYNPQMREGKPYTTKNRKTTTELYGRDYKITSTANNGERKPIDVIKFSNGNYKSSHPTAKPVPLLEYLIKTYTNEGETVLDNCMGSGSTGVACANTNRNFIGIELDENFYEIAKSQIKQVFLQKG